MYKVMKILLAVTAAIFMSACGGGSSSDSTVDPIDPMTERDLIVIFYHSPEGMCEDETFQELLKDEMASQGYVIDYYLFREETNNVSCATYNRTEAITETGGCATYDLSIEDPSFAVFDTSCVLGIDADINAQPVAKYTNVDSKGEYKDTNIVMDMASVMQAW